MPKFTLNKLVRDNLINEYFKLNQKPIYRELSKQEHLKALTQKLQEEVVELLKAAPEDITAELADIQQVVDSITTIYDVNPEEVEAIKQQKSMKSGGFEKGYYVETLELDEDDEWTAYYRRDPDVFTES